jgi:hypothetical protein
MLYMVKLEYDFRIDRQYKRTYKSPKLNKINTEFLFPLGTFSFSNWGIGMRRITKSMAMEIPLDANVALLLSIQWNSTLLSKTAPANLLEGKGDHS